MHCPDCNALNPDDAPWCALCLRRFVSEPEEAEPEADLRVAPVSAPVDGMPLIRTDPPEVEEAWGAVAHSQLVQEGPLRASGKEVTWVCPACTRQNSIKNNLCVACGTSFFEAFKAPEPTMRASRDPNLAAIFSLIPGVGHLYIGRVADGVTRLLLALWWWSFAIFVPSPTAAMLGVRVLYTIAAFGLVAVSIYDAHRQAMDPGALPLLDRRLVMWSAMILGSMMIVGAITSFMAAT